MEKTIGFVGIGAMGLPMASNLLAAGYSLRVYNRNAEKTEDLVDSGAAAAVDPADAAHKGGVVITMLADDPALEDVALSGDSLARRLGQGGIHLSMSTVSPAVARRIASHHEKFGAVYLAAPVFGRPEAAAAKKLWICCSGPADAFRRVEPILGAIGQGTFYFGNDPGAANVVKLAGNFMIAATVEALTEAAVFAEKAGVDAEECLAMLSQTLFACVIHQNYGRTILDRRWEPPGFRLRLGLKDIGLVLDTARESRTPMPLAALAYDRLLSGVAKGRSELDFTAMSLAVAEDAGLDWSSSEDR